MAAMFGTTTPPFQEDTPPGGPSSGQGVLQEGCPKRPLGWLEPTFAILYTYMQEAKPGAVAGAAAGSAAEQQLIARAAGGDLDAFNQLVLTYQNLAYSVAYRTLQEEDAAADAVQESMIKAFRSLGSFQGGSFKSWIIRIVVNTCYDALRSRKRRRTDSLDDFGDDDYGTDGASDYSPQLEDPAERPDAYVQRMELSQLIEQGIARLPADQRLALTLCDVHGYAYEEIGEITGMPMGTVKSRINRARTKLREYLLQYPELLPASFRP
jgi:RNA polymerase sigma-70 factor, ECF subfamily